LHAETGGIQQQRHIACSLLTRVTPQFHKGYIYATAHGRDVDWSHKLPSFLPGGKTLVWIKAGFEVAPGDASDIEFANAHWWGSWCLVFSDSTAAATASYIALHPNAKGIFCSFFDLQQALT
jgi:hypothetical protein